MGAIRVKHNDKAISKYLYYQLNNIKFNQYLLSQISAVNINNLSSNILLNYYLPLPPLEVQREIVAEIEGYQKLIDGCRQVVDSWKPDIEGYLDEELKLYLEQHPEKKEELKDGWPMVRLGTIVDILDSQRRPITKHDRKPGPYPYYGATGVLDYVDEYLFDEPLVLVGEDGAKWGPGEKTAYAISGKTWVNNHAHVLRPIRERLMDVFLIVVLNTMDLSQYITGVTVPKLNQEKLRGIQIPLPPLEVQEVIVAKIEAEQKIIDGCRELIKTYEEKIKRVIDRVWEG